MSPREVKPIEGLLATSNRERTPEDWIAAKEEYADLKDRVLEAEAKLVRVNRVNDHLVGERGDRKKFTEETPCPVSSKGKETERQTAAFYWQERAREWEQDARQWKKEARLNQKRVNEITEQFKTKKHIAQGLGKKLRSVEAKNKKLDELSHHNTTFYLKVICAAGMAEHCVHSPEQLLHEIGETKKERVVLRCANTRLQEVQKKLEADLGSARAQAIAAEDKSNEDATAYWRVVGLNGRMRKLLGWYGDRANYGENEYGHSSVTRDVGRRARDFLGEGVQEKPLDQSETHCPVCGCPWKNHGQALDCPCIHEREPSNAPTCTWTYDQDADYFETSCDNPFCTDLETIKAGLFKWCPYCRLEIEVEIEREEETDG